MKFRALLLALAGFTVVTGGSSSAAPLTYGSYYDETMQLYCNTGTVCRINFGQTPADKLLMIRKINCQLQTSVRVTQGNLFIATTNGGQEIQRSLPLPIPSPVAGSTYVTNFESDAHWLVGQGRFPYLYFYANGLTDWNTWCTITGDLVTPIQ